MASLFRQFINEYITAIALNTRKLLDLTKVKQESREFICTLCVASDWYHETMVTMMMTTIVIVEMKMVIDLEPAAPY